MSVKYNLVTDDGEVSSITVFMGKGKQQVATPAHPNFAAILNYLQSNSEPDEGMVRDMFDISHALNERFVRVSERVLVKHGTILFDGSPINDSLGETILKFYDEGNSNFLPLVNFMEKVQQNPNPNSRERLFTWMSQPRCNFGIHPDGDFIAYKRCDKKTGIDGYDKGEYTYFSTTQGMGIVNGQVIQHGYLPNIPGTIVEMPRDKVTFDPHEYCSAGLHVANWDFAYSFGYTPQRGVIVQVKVNPRDVVSVPEDAQKQKMRVCRYRVLGEVTREDDSILFLKDEWNRKSKVIKLTDNDQHKLAAIKAESTTIQVEHNVENIDVAVPVKPKRIPRKAKKIEAKPAPELVWPEYYEQYKKAHWEQVPFNDARSVAKSVFEIELPTPLTKETLVDLLTKESRKRLMTWPKEER